MKMTQKSFVHLPLTTKLLICSSFDSHLDVYFFLKNCFCSYYYLYVSVSLCSRTQETWTTLGVFIKFWDLLISVDRLSTLNIEMVLLVYIHIQTWQKNRIWRKKHQNFKIWKKPIMKGRLEFPTTSLTDYC